MAGSKVRFNGRVQASSLLEVVVAMVVIIMVLGIALSIFTNVMRSSLSVRQLRAQAVLEEAMQAAEYNAGQAAPDTLAKGWKVEQETQSYGEGGRLTQVHLRLYDGNHELIAELRKVIISKPPAQ